MLLRNFWPTLLLLLVALCANTLWADDPNLFSPHCQNSTKEQEFRDRDARIQSQFNDAVRKKRNHELTMKQYRSTVKKLRHEESQLFSLVGKHKFNDETEYNYWHRGRMKFPSVLAQEAEWLKRKQGPTPSDNLQP